MKHAIRNYSLAMLKNAMISQSFDTFGEEHKKKILYHYLRMIMFTDLQYRVKKSEAQNLFGFT